MKRILTQKDMSAARHAQEIDNSMIKRGEINAPEKIVRTQHVVCGCGVEGCIFISHQRKE